ncbi:MAG: DUF1003 domain-containing protein [Armatimonadia bacterium]
MTQTDSSLVRCPVCQKEKPREELISGRDIRSSIAEAIRRRNPDWNTDQPVCREDVEKFRTLYVQDALEAERGELTDLDREVINSLASQRMMSTDIYAAYDRTTTVGQRLADRMADVAGSWAFILCFGFFLAVWIAINVIALVRHFDPFPFILLNLILSCLAAVQAPVIMMSQNRQEDRDRLRAENDYQINLKAELEIKQLHEKLDHIMTHQWERLAEIQQIQMDLMNELMGQTKTNNHTHTD